MTAWPEYGARLPLWEAVYRQDGTAVQKILADTSGDGTRQVNVAHGIWMQTSVHLAVQKGNSKVLKALLFARADANARMINGTTPLHLAVTNRRKDMIQDLLLVGANPLLRNFTNQTAIQMAEQQGMRDTVPLLLRAAQSLPVQRALRKQQEAQEEEAKRLVHH